MRSVIVTLLVILGIVFGSTHASAFQHIDEDAHTIAQTGDHFHSHADDDEDEPQGSEPMGSEVGTHNHCAMDRAVTPSALDCLVRVTSGVSRPPAVRALSSLDQVPPLEPPSA